MSLLCKPCKAGSPAQQHDDDEKWKQQQSSDGSNSKIATTTITTITVSFAILNKFNSIRMIESKTTIITIMIMVIIIRTIIKDYTLNIMYHMQGRISCTATCNQSLS